MEKQGTQDRGSDPSESNVNFFVLDLFVVFVPMLMFDDHSWHLYQMNARHDAMFTWKRSQSVLTSHSVHNATYSGDLISASE